MDFKDIATVSGKSGLFSVVAPTRGGMILESMDAQKKKLIVNVNSKVSILGEISIYTTDKEGTCSLSDVMKKIHVEFKGDTDLSSNSTPEELKSFLKFILPEYDEDRVYVSDIKKLVSWYNILSVDYPELLLDTPKAEVIAETKMIATKEKAETPPKAAKKTKSTK